MEIYLGNLDGSTTAQGLQGLFEPFGMVNRADVPHVGSAAFGRVEMPEAVDEQRAIHGLSDTHDHGK
jgi:hypothetical protein